MYRDSSRIFASALLALTGWFQADALAQNGAQPEKLLRVWAGNLPIIITAPHGGREAIPEVPLREGRGVAQFKTGRDHNTAELAERIAMKLTERLGASPFLIMARFDRKYIDANRPPSGAYEAAAAQPYYAAFHAAVDEACKQVRQFWRRGLLLDIHGQAAEVNVIFRGTRNGKSVAALVQHFGVEALTGSHSISGQLAVMDYKILPDPAGNGRETRYIGGHISQRYGSHRGTGIDAIQLEFGSHHRARVNLDKTASDMADAVAVFARKYLPLEQNSTDRKAEDRP